MYDCRQGFDVHRVRESFNATQTDGLLAFRQDIRPNHIEQPFIVVTVVGKLVVNLRAPSKNMEIITRI